MAKDQEKIVVMTPADASLFKEMLAWYRSESRSPSGLLSAKQRSIFPKDHRTGLCMTDISAGLPLLGGSGYVKFDRYNSANQGFVDEDDEPTLVVNYSTTTFLAGTRVWCSKDRSAVETEGNDGFAKITPVWTVCDYTASVDDFYIREIKVGRDSSPVQTWTAPQTMFIHWKNTQTSNTDPLVFEQVHGPASQYEYIKVKKNGIYRIHHRVNFDYLSTYNVDEILRTSSQVIRKRGTGGAEAVVLNSWDTADMMIINDLGAERGSLQATTHYSEALEGDLFRVEVAHDGSADDTRQLSVVGGVFIMTYLKTYVPGTAV